MARMKIIFDGFEELAEAIDKAGLDLKSAVDDALTETQKIVQNNVEEAAAVYGRRGGGRKGYATGSMYRAIIKDASIDWKGNVAEVGVGFDLHSEGGFHSIFVMYGTPRHKKNNRGIAKDTKLYNAIKGVRTQQKIAEKQEEIMQKHLRIGG